MITRSAKRKSMHLQCNSLLLQVSGNDTQIQSQSSISVEGSGYVPPGNKEFQKSIYSIYIHLPSNKINTVKLSMSGIQPLNHVCLNKVLKTLELNIGNESIRLTPNLGDMELPFANNSAERNYLELENNTSSQRCLTDNVTEGTDEIKNVSLDNSKESCGSNKSFEQINNSKIRNSKEISSYTCDINSIKLNRAVVVLTDICKTKYYKAAFANSAAKGQIKISEIGDKENVSSSVVKRESLTNSTDIIDNCCTNTTDSTLDTRPSLESVNNAPLSGSRLLTQLAEGCSFSEILNRFQIKNGNCLVDTLKCADTPNHENFNTECLEDQDNRIIKSESYSLPEDEDTMECLLTSDVTEKIESIDFAHSNLLGVSQGSEYEESRESTEHLRNLSLDSQVESDHNENTNAVQSISWDVSADKETVDSSCLTSNVKCNVTTYEEICTISETSKNHINNTNNLDLNLHESGEPNLEMDKERMNGKKFPAVNKSKRKKNKKSKSTTTTPCHSPSPKKMKKSNEKSETLHNNRILPDEYIPLQTSGPTKFGVAMLNQIKPYIHHDAKDFKNKMLFGDRNRRVSSSEHLRIYKLKQKVNRSVRG